MSKPGLAPPPVVVLGIIGQVAPRLPINIDKIDSNESFITLKKPKEVRMRR